MHRNIRIVITVIATSFYLFPVYFAFLPVVNTKMAMAAAGLCVLGYKLLQKDTRNVDGSFLTLTLWAFAISLASLVAMAVNGTHDGSFLTYFISMWVWLGGAYMLIAIIRWTHNYVSVPLVCNYCVAICACQCILAWIFKIHPEFDEYVMSHFIGESYMGIGVREERMHGIGCALDVAGLKFATVLIFISIMVSRIKNGNYLLFGFYIASFFIITVIGNMISRTTIVGVGLALLYWGGVSFYNSYARSHIIAVAVLIALSVPVISGIYNRNEAFRDSFRFGFEGFFSVSETGKWRTSSNDVLKNMVVWPNNVKTWLIGDGYAANPNDKDLPTYDPYYIGPSFHGYYMQTDIGYCRYIFYFGIIGLGAFLVFFFKVTSILIHKFPHWRIVFMAILVVNLIGWTKVSTDLFVVFALFLCIPVEEEKKTDEISRPYVNWEDEGKD